jgi:TolB-like protein
MADIFISYSSNDRQKADQLTELLASAGLSVWIDKSGIDLATSWSKEIVDAIDGCKALVVLLSLSSIASVNVAKEIALAGERGKKILPLDLEPVTLPNELAYHLAGLQRAPMTNIDAIIRAIGKLGLEATQAPTMKLVKETDSRKSLMILPFEDLSPTADNQWFADGIVSEMISSLSNVKALRLVDAQATKEFKSYKGQLTVYAREMGVRYFVQGDVRKFGDNIKITSRLLDIETGDYLWQDALKGMMVDIFDMQEQVARKVLDGLKVHLSTEEHEKVSEYATENAEAYELYLKGREYFDRHTKIDFERAIALFDKAREIDPDFASAHASFANTLTELYRGYDRNSDHLIRAEEAIERMRELKGENALYSWVMSKLAMRRDDPKAALRYAEEAIKYDPNYAPGYAVLAFASEALEDGERQIWARKEELRLRPIPAAQFNLLVSLDRWGHKEELLDEARHAIPMLEKHARLNPDNYFAGIQYAVALLMAEHIEEALSEAHALSQVPDIDGVACINLAGLYLSTDRIDLAALEVQRALKKGFRGLEVFRNPDFAPLLQMPEIAALLAEIEVKNTEKAHG